MRRILQVFCAIFSGFILAAAIPNEFLNFGSPLIGLFTLVPLYMALSDSRSPSWSGLLCAIYFFTQHMLSSYWLGYFKDFAIFTLGASAFGTAGIGYFCGIVFSLPFNRNGRLFPTGFSGFSRLQERAGLNSFALPFRILCFASLFTLMEWVKSNGFIGYPWGTLIMTSYKWKTLTQIVDITGTWGITYLFSLFSAVIAEGFLLLRFPFVKESLNPKESHSYAFTAAFCLILFMCGTVYGAIQYARVRPVEKTVSVLLVQSNINSWTAFNERTAIKTSQSLTTKAINENNKKPDVVIWNESVISSYCFPDADSYYNEYPEEEPLKPFIAKAGVPFILGGPVLVGWSASERPQICNAALYFDKKGNYRDYYGKMHLVPFAEYIPFSDNPIVRIVLDKVIGFSDGWTPGLYPELFKVPLASGKTVNISAPVCFDDAFPSVCGKLFHAGSEIFANITNDSWSATDSAEYQHFVISSFRAIEYRTPLVRSATAGYTVVVDSSGKIIADLPLFTDDTIMVDVPITKRIITVYARLGDWLPWVLLLMVLGYAIFSAITFKQNSISIIDNNK